MKKDILKQKDFIKSQILNLKTKSDSCELTRLIQLKQTVKALIKKQKVVVKSLENRYGEVLKTWIDEKEHYPFSRVQYAINTYDEFHDVLIVLKEMKKEIDLKINSLADEQLTDIKININQILEQ